MKYYTREIEDRFLRVQKDYKVVLITGQRQVGKTTMLKKIKDDKRKFVVLDNDDMRAYAYNNTSDFIKEYCPPCIIDEVQKVPKVFGYIKEVVDGQDKNNLYWLSGSHQFELMRGVSDSLSGRIALLQMYSLTYSEINKIIRKFDINNLVDKGRITKDEVLDAILKGGMPKYVIDSVERKQFFSDYISTYLDRDVRDLKVIGDLNKFRRFMVAIASRAGELINYDNIAKEVKTTIPTIESWLSVLEASNIIKLIYPYKTDELNRVISTPKLIFMDSGLETYLCNIHSKTKLLSRKNLGNIFENYIISEIIKINNNYGLFYNLYYYRDKENKEIDLIVETDDGIYPFEIKMDSNVDIRMIKSFSVLNKDSITILGGGIIHIGESINDLNDTFKSYPISSFLK